MAKDDCSAEVASPAATQPSSAAVMDKGATCVRGRKKVKKARKRKSRAVAKPPIRMLSANKSNFRDLVLRLTGNPPSSSPQPPPPPPPSPLHAHAHTTTPSCLSSPTCAPPPFANDALLTIANSLLSLLNPLNSPNHSLSFGHPTSPSPSSPSIHGPHPISSPSIDDAHFMALLHSPPYPSSSPHATLMHGDDKFNNTTLEFLQALNQSLLQIKRLGEWGFFNFGLLGKTNHDTTSTGGSNDNIQDVDLKPLLRSQVDHTLKKVNKCVMECTAHVKSLDLEHLQNVRKANELENFLLTKDDKLDDLFIDNVLHNVNSWLSCDTTRM